MFMYCGVVWDIGLMLNACLCIVVWCEVYDGCLWNALLDFNALLQIF